MKRQPRGGDDLLYRLSPNQRAILDLIRAQGDISRAELAVRTGLTPGSLTRQIKDLLAHSLVEEGERRSGQRGQPALPISLRANAAYSIGVTFSLHEIEVVAIDFRGRTVAETTEPFAFSSAGELADQCSALVRRIELSPPLADSRVLGVGVAVPGYFRSDAPLIMDTVDALVMLAGIDLDIFAAAFDRPTWVENNSSAAALAEYYNRIDLGVRHLVLVNVGYGFSAGFVIDGKLYRGRGGNAGEIGRLYPRGTPRPSALDLVGTLASAGQPVRSMGDLADAVATAGPVVVEWIERASDQLRHVMNILDFTLAPDEMILGGQIPEVLARKLGAAIAGKPEGPGRPLDHRTSRLGPMASAVGAAFLPIYQTSSHVLGRSRMML